MSYADVAAALPIVTLVVGSGVAMVFERAFPADERVSGWLAGAFALAAATAAIIAGTGNDAFGGLLRRDGAAVFATAVLGLGAAAAMALDAGQQRPRDLPLRGRHAYSLVAAAGAVLMATAADLLVVFLSVEVLFMALVALVAGTRAPATRGASREVFVLCGTASALFAAGVGLVWTETGTFATGSLATVATPAGQAGTALIVIGLACFAGLAPFHWWVATASEALTAPSASLVAILPRTAALIALVRCGAVITTSGSASLDWRACLAILAAASLALGAISALSESSLKKTVAHLSVGYSGLLTVAAAAGTGASAAVAIGVACYALLVTGAFALISFMPSDAPTIGDLHGLARRRPLSAAALGITFVALAGLPPTVGFFSRLAIFEAAVDAQLAWLAFVAAFATVVSFAASTRVIFAAVERGAGAVTVTRTVSAIAFATALVALALGVVPDPLLELARSVRF